VNASCAAGWPEMRSRVFLTPFGDAYFFLISSKMLSRAWIGWLLSSSSAGLPALQLVCQQSM
jgi:hypothetical protein